MKKLLLPLLLAAAVLTGCNGTPARVAYNTVAAPAITVDHAMNAWGDYVAKYQPSADVEQKVKYLYEKYQAAEQVAIDAAQTYATVAGSTNAPDVAQALAAKQQAENLAGQDLTDLVNFLQSVGVQL